MTLDLSKEPDSPEPSRSTDSAAVNEPQTTESATADDPGASDATTPERADSESEQVTKAQRTNKRKPGADEQSAGTARSVAFAASAVALVAALAVAVWFGAGWVQAAFFTDGPRAEARDEALDGARQAALNMTSTNLDDVPGSLELARSSMTGALLASANKNQAEIEQLATGAGVTMRSKVVGSALTSLNSERDRASALVVLQVTEAPPNGPSSDYRYTWSLNMVEDGDTWKAEQVASLEQPVLLSGPGPSGPNPNGTQQAPPEDPATPDQPKPGS